MTTPPPTGGPTPVRVDDLLHIEERDYRYGAGVLLLRVTEILDTMHLDDGPWITLRGTQLYRDGRPRGERQTLVRVAALDSARQAYTAPRHAP